ncbi:PqqD family peptide modification chaperone [Chrysosporum bergii ANA360D]|uniref:PqqD family peptide modification chaperone n=1 Tax=Chrysosporum bergii ANA360D TaxID=617107 RepID=A0AA43KB75_9CYAN|nr:PqqD family protein [Chrysosporum bergii]MDH6060134.1 PqqD family peptide modification chaperone [Chrysosporum bergii ANA360D]
MNFTPINTDISENCIVVAVKEQIFSEVGQEAVILHLNTGIYHGVNEVGTRIWNLIQQPKAVKDIKQILLQEYAVTSEDCDRDLIALLKDFLAVALIEVKNEITT